MICSKRGGLAKPAIANQTLWYTIPGDLHAVTCWHLRCSVGRCKREQAEMCVKAVLAVADLARKDVNLELIKVQMSAGSGPHVFRPHALQAQQLASHQRQVDGCAPRSPRVRLQAPR